MATEEFQIGYEAGYQDGWNEAKKLFVGLTDEERTFFVKSGIQFRTVKAIEAKLREKNA